MTRVWELGLLLVLLAGCAVAPPSPTATPPPPQVPPAEPLVLLSTAFAHEGEIPERYGFFRENVSPPLRWEHVPAGTRSLVLLMDDLDYPFSHWVVYNIPPDTAGLDEGQVPAEALQGRNTAGTLGYVGPYPPAGQVHRYAFTLYALDTALELPAGATRPEVVAAIQNHILASAELVGRYRGVER
ncbi:MAG: YbhB/YbcL family Raf kinase inhibitor-like protein [Chloroflexia bacterium]